ncbi:hypothetical protein [Massilia sp. LC238]|uniref:hypothetical protein n=1 Tax=Massilia sp. LC238 TaxID=1502852 RepID=UPI0004E3E4EC|nr:hypothetical protein [Massilia sp. LC238]KFC68289.1 hypothetical protein FG94_02767 [Massilia sp. LC238]
MQHTLVAVFDNRTDAQNAMNELMSSGFARDEVKLSNADPTGMTDSVTGSTADTGSSDTLADGTGIGIGASIKHFFTDLFGADNSEHASRYEGAVTRGHHVLTVRAQSLPEVERAADIVERYGPTDIDEQASGVGAMGAASGLSESMRVSGAGGMQQSSRMSAQSGTGMSSSTTAGSGSLGTGAGVGAATGASQQLDNPGDRKLFQQQSLHQAEPMGTTYQEPMGQSGLSATGGTSLQGSTLQENSVQASSLEGTQNDMSIRSSGGQGGTLQGSSLEGSAMQGGAGSMQRDTAMGSSPGSSRFTETQRGRSRIYSPGAGTAGTGSGLDIGSNFFGDDDDYYRNHFLANYSGEDYDRIKPAYAYGSEMARDDKYRGRKWDEVENDLRSDWSTRSGDTAGDTWDRMKAAVRRGWDRMTNDDDDTIYRSHFSSTYGTAGGSYDDYAPAYSYGAESARSDKYRGRRWDEVENDLHSGWDTRSGSTAGSTWEKMKSAVRRGWDRMTLDKDDDNYYRSHYDTNLGSSGMDYDSVKPAYAYGSEMRKSELYRNRPWDDIEGDLARGWDSRISGGTGASTAAGTGVGGAWESMKSAVRHGWDRMTDDDDNDREYRSHWNATYSTSSDAGSYDDYKPAYAYGSSMAQDPKYRGRQWGEVENDLRTDWDTRYGSGGQSTWEKMKSAVRHGWDRMTS